LAEEEDPNLEQEGSALSDQEDSAPQVENPVDDEGNNEEEVLKRPEEPSLFEQDEALPEGKEEIILW
jgi:hypothetical protein